MRDVVEAYRLLLQPGGPKGPFNIASGEAHAIGDLLERLLALARVPIAVAVDESRLRPSDVPALCGDASRLRAALGWAPVRAISTARWLDTLEYYRAARPQPEREPERSAPLAGSGRTSRPHCDVGLDRADPLGVVAQHGEREQPVDARELLAAVAVRDHEVDREAALAERDLGDDEVDGVDLAALQVEAARCGRRTPSPGRRGR